MIAAWQHKGEPWRIILDRDIEEVRKHSGSWNPLYTAPPAPTVASGENCWSCGKFFTYAQHSESDGYCPHCNAPVDLDEGELNDEG